MFIKLSYGYSTYSEYSYILLLLLLCLVVMLTSVMQLKNHKQHLFFLQPAFIPVENKKYQKKAA